MIKSWLKQLWAKKKINWGHKVAAPLKSVVTSHFLKLSFFWSKPIKKHTHTMLADQCRQCVWGWDVWILICCMLASYDKGGALQNGNAKEKFVKGLSYGATSGLSRHASYLYQTSGCFPLQSATRHHGSALADTALYGENFLGSILLPFCEEFSCLNMPAWVFCGSFSFLLQFKNMQVWPSGECIFHQ